MTKTKSRQASKQTADEDVSGTKLVPILVRVPPHVKMRLTAKAKKTPTFTGHTGVSLSAYCRKILEEES